MKPIVIIAAVPQETELLEKMLEYSIRVKTGGLEYVEGSIGNLLVKICVGGVGKIHAAAATAVMIDRCQPQLVINTGCAGAYSGSGLSSGDLVVACEEVLADDGVIVTEGWKDLEFMKLSTGAQGGQACFNTLPLSVDASERAMQLADYYGIFLMRGRCATVSTCSGTLERGAELAERWNVIAESMEGAAVVQVCLRYAVDCLEIRGISNLVEDRDMKNWDMPRAVEAAQRFVLKYIEEMNQPDLLP